MAVEIERITPGRGRTGAVVTIEGTGFGASLGLTAVTVDGFGAAVSASSTTSVTCTVPPGIDTAKHVDVVVTNITDSTSDTFRWWSKSAASGLATTRLPITVHGPAERSLTNAEEFPGVLMARTWERMLSRLELLPFDLLTAKGRMAARGNAGGLVSVAAGTAGQRYVRQGSTGGVFRDRAVASLVWGRQVQAAEAAEVLMCAGGRDALTTSQGEEAVAPFACRLSLLQVAVRDSSPAVNAINRVRVLVNGVAVWDSQSLDAEDEPSIAGAGTWAGYPWLALVAGDRVSIGLTKSGATSVMSVSAQAVLT